MVKGLDYFREYFKGFEDRYILIGGTACDVLMNEAGLEFRATKDLDIVLCAEALDAEFVARFWQFVREGEYEHKEKSTGDKQFYRFKNPSGPKFPEMLELFSRKPDELVFEGEGNLTPIPFDEDVSSLSAILLNDAYYRCIERGRLIINGVSVLGPEYILVFKARAWIDLSSRKAKGAQVDSKKIKKHRNDVFRISALLAPSQRVELEAGIRKDMQHFVESMVNEPGLDISNFGLTGSSLNEVLTSLRIIYQLEA